MIYLITRVIPRISEVAMPVPQRKYLDEWAKKIPFDKIDAFLNSLAAKFLRKAKIFILKLDNLIGDSLSKFKPANNSGKEVLNRDILQPERDQEVKKGENQ